MAPEVLVQVWRGGRRWRKGLLDGVPDLQSKNLEHILTVTFVPASYFVLIRNPPDVYKLV